MALFFAVVNLMVGMAAAQLPRRYDSCVAANSSNCCENDNGCEGPPAFDCYCDIACYSISYRDCCYDVAQTCDQGISFTTSGTARSGETYILTCSIVPQPQLGPLLSIALYDDLTGLNTTILRNVTSNDSSLQTLQLEISPLQTSHGGQYTCQVTYRNSDNNTYALYLPTAVDVEITAPSVSISQESPNQPLTVGNSANLTCTITFSAAVDTLDIEVHVTWIGPQDAVLNISDSDPILVQEAALLTYESTLYLSSLELSDFGAYTCIASGYPVMSPFITASTDSSATVTLVQTQRPVEQPEPSETPSIKDPSSADSNPSTVIAAGVAAGVVALIVAASLVGVICILIRKHHCQSWLVGEPSGNQTSGSKKTNVQAVSFPNRVTEQLETKDEDMEIIECTAYGILTTQPENTYSIPRQQNHYSVPRQQQESDPQRPQENVYSVPNQVPSSAPPCPAPKPVQGTPIVQHVQLHTTENIYDNPDEANIYEPITM